jgi:hypothetical protein
VWVEAGGGLGGQGYAAGCRHGSRYGGGVAQGAAVVGPVGGGAGPRFERGMREGGGQPRAVTDVGLGQPVGVGERERAGTTTTRGMVRACSKTSPSTGPTYWTMPTSTMIHHPAIFEDGP